jgi:hypothetical protein
MSSRYTQPYSVWGTPWCAHFLVVLSAPSCPSRVALSTRGVWYILQREIEYPTRCFFCCTQGGSSTFLQTCTGLGRIVMAEVQMMKLKKENRKEWERLQTNSANTKMHLVCVCVWLP